MVLCLVAILGTAQTWFWSNSLITMPTKTEQLQQNSSTSTATRRIERGRASDPQHEDSCALSNTGPLLRLKMLLNESPFYLRKRALMLDGPPRGRSPVALRKRKHSNITKDLDTVGTFQESKSRSRGRSHCQPVGIIFYPPYIPIPGVFASQVQSASPTRTKPLWRTEMVRGETCQLVMQLLSERRSIREVINQLPFECDSDDAVRMAFEVTDVQAIAKYCREHGLTAHRPLQVDAEDWEGEEIEEWWHDAMEERWRDDPVQMEGWWTKVGHRLPECQQD